MSAQASEISQNKTRVDTSSWLTKELIEEAVKNAGGPAADATVADLTVTPIGGGGENYGSVIHRVVARTSRGDYHLLVKSLPTGDVLRDIVTRCELFPKESRMFQKVVPEMERLLRTGPPLSASCLLHRTEPSDVLVFTDLSAEGFRMASRHRGLDRAHTSLALQALARFHGASYFIWKTQPQLFDIFDNPFEGPAGEWLKELMETAARTTAKEVSSWDFYPSRYGEKIAKMEGRVYKIYKEAHDFREGKFNVLVHGDYWINNMMFKYDGDQVTEVRLVDLQGCHLGSPAVDLTGFKNGSLTEEVYFEHWPGLMKEYHSTLSECMGALGYGADCPGLDELEAEMREFAPFGFVNLIGWLPFVKLEPGRAYDFDKVAKEGPSAEADAYSNPEVKRWLRQILPVFECLGALDHTD